MKTIKFGLLTSFVLVAVLSACKTPTTIHNEYATSRFNVECLGIDPDGSQTLRSWGSGINKDKAIEQALRKAVEAVIFSGITDGSAGCSKAPLLNEVNARERHEDYFNSFFAEGGAFNRFVNLEEKRTSRIKSANSSMETWGVVVKVNRSTLKKHLQSDNIIKP
ncbi:MAG: hypothetical protein HDS04_02670 [Bacteroides sp.]|nr:hypothetical protein [Bacteroides sp.]